jgi:hypothetical protein
MHCSGITRRSLVQPCLYLLTYLLHFLIVKLNAMLCVYITPGLMTSSTWNNIYTVHLTTWCHSSIWNWRSEWTYDRLRIRLQLYHLLISYASHSMKLKPLFHSILMTTLFMKLNLWNLARNLNDRWSLLLNLSYQCHYFDYITSSFDAHSMNIWPITKVSASIYITHIHTAVLTRA